MEEREQDLYIFNEVKRYDYDRWLTALFVPGPRRAGMFVLLAFNTEIARIRETVSEPMLGDIRLQWWRDALDSMAAGKAPPSHPVAGALARLVAEHNLPIDELRRMIDARASDLDVVPFQTLDELCAYAHDTGGLLSGLMFRLWGDDSAEGLATAREVGAAYALTGLIRGIPYHVRHDVLRIPADMIAARGLTPEGLFQRENSAAFFAITRELGERAAALQRSAKEKITERGPQRRAFYRLAALTSLYLKRLEKAGFDPGHRKLDIGPVRKIAALARGR